MSGYLDIPTRSYEQAMHDVLSSRDLICPTENTRALMAQAREGGVLVGPMIRAQIRQRQKNKAARLAFLYGALERESA